MLWHRSRWSRMRPTKSSLNTCNYGNMIRSLIVRFSSLSAFPRNSKRTQWLDWKSPASACRHLRTCWSDRILPLRFRDGVTNQSRSPAARPPEPTSSRIVRTIRWSFCSRNPAGGILVRDEVIGAMESRVRVSRMCTRLPEQRKKSAATCVRGMLGGMFASRRCIERFCTHQWLGTSAECASTIKLCTVFKRDFCDRCIFEFKRLISDGPIE